ncbi:MAG: HD domain-containing protein [Candidatus Aminicenantes bacterium]|nr:MAG: HD domain-containing protein [Candidatus Aminicenantes bacterium]
MNTAKLDYPVHTLDNRLLLPAGKLLTSEALDELIATNKGTSYQVLPFLEYGTVYQDILRLLQKPPYCVIFDELKSKIVLNLMKKINFIPPVLESLDYFKENDFYTYRHSLMVFAMSTIMARDLLEKSEDWIMEAMAGTIHDYGKICIPLQILNKSDPLTRTDRSILEHHALAGFVLLSYLLKDHRSFAARVAKEHHERRDGSGYPLGISLRDRMVEIIAACDVYDALLSPRPYRPIPYDNRTALEEIIEMAQGGKLSWDVVQTLVSHNRKDRPHFRECRVSTEKRGIPPADNLYGIIAHEDADNNRG